MQIFGYYLPVIRRVCAGITVLLALAVARFYPAPPPDYHGDAGVKSFVLFDALTRAQGVTTDGEYFYFSWNYGITKTNLAGDRVVRRNLLAIPPALLLKGVDHFGGISHYDGKLYCALEDSKVFENLYIAVYDACTLRLIQYKAVPLEAHEFGIPWCAADPDTGLVYSARRDHFTELNIYDPDTLEPVGTLSLDAPVHKIQGGEVHNGVLYAAASGEGQAIFAIHLATGRVQTVFVRNVPGGKGQGMTILPMEGGAFFHVLDEDKARLSIHLRSYVFDPATLAW